MFIQGQWNIFLVEIHMCFYFVIKILRYIVVRAVLREKNVTKEAMNYLPILGHQSEIT